LLLDGQQHLMTAAAHNQLNNTPAAEAAATAAVAAAGESLSVTQRPSKLSLYRQTSFT
jgi:hypothetical protein